MLSWKTEWVTRWGNLSWQAILNRVVSFNSSLRVNVLIHAENERATKKKQAVVLCFATWTTDRTLILEEAMSKAGFMLDAPVVAPVTSPQRGQIISCSRFSLTKGAAADKWFIYTAGIATRRRREDGVTHHGNDGQWCIEHKSILSPNFSDII